MDSSIIAAAAFAVNTAVVLIGGGVAFQRQKTEMQAMVSAVHKELDDKIDSSTVRFGETAAAIRQKINEVELFMRDQYIKRDSFHHGLNNLAESIKSFNLSLDARLIRMETKIDEGRKSQRESGGT